MRGERIIFLGLVLFLLVFSKTSFAGDANEEMKFGFYADRVVVATQTILFNDALTKRVTKIGNKVAKATDKPDMKYTFRIISDPTINAYSASGGFVYINTGLLDVLESEDELATILAHEIHHTNASHQINFIYAAHRRKVAGQVTGVLTSTVLGAVAGVAGEIYKAQNPYNPYASQMADQVYKSAVEVGLKLGDEMTVSMIKGYGKKQELEADAYAVKYTQKAGYDPNALIGVFKKLVSIRNRLGINERNYVSSLINAEPGLEERIKNAEELILNPDKNKQPKEERREES
ncbi:MAG: M48 family metalloprotease [Candidatus Omnitrophica bacterium]|nr:M48 family metalloprotease [Candidatus Omnitrophota bacterium]